MVLVNRLGLILFLFSSAFAQLTSYELYLLDKETHAAVPFALCYLQKNYISATSFENGLVKFQLTEHYVKDSLIIKHLSYLPEIIAFGKQTDTIYLSPKENFINEISVTGLSAEKIVAKAVGLISQNFSQNTQYLNGIYRQTHLENSQYVRFIEAKCIVEQSHTRREKFLITDVRRSFNYEKNGEQHGDHLADLFNENAVAYLNENFLNPKFLKKINWQLDSITQSSYSISFNGIDTKESIYFQGIININTTDFGIMDYQLASTPTSTYKTLSNWKLKSDFVRFEFEKQGNHYQLKLAEKWYVHEVYHPVTFTNPSIIEERFSWQTTDHLNKVENPAAFKFASNLYSVSFPYHPFNWLHVSIDDKIVKDLSHRLPLENQFSQQ